MSCPLDLVNQSVLFPSEQELRSNQHRVDQLEAKCSQLMAENVELKRLCLYLDEQRQAGWRQLASKNEVGHKSHWSLIENLLRNFFWLILNPQELFQTEPFWTNWIRTENLS